MRRKITTWAAALVLAIGWTASAQDAGPGPIQNPAQNPAQNPVQNRAVRLSTVEGQVRILQSGQSVTDQAVANTPLFDGFGIQTGDDGRAELQFPDGTIGRVPPDGSLSLANLNQGPGDLVLDHGMAYIELRGAERVRFAGYTATASGSATLRVKLDENPGELAVFDGSAHLDGPGGSLDLRGGESVKLVSQGALSAAETIEPDSWDAWNSDRDQALSSEAGSTTQATRGMPDSNNPAWGDLNQNGNWYNVPGEGYVWSPYDASDGSWDPYGNGYWMDNPSYGYTWVSGYSWGYLPYQCGLWNWYSGFGWGWAPGGCSPWWGGGGGVWIINIGRGPVGWRPPLRPLRPRGGPGRPRPGGGVRAIGPQPVIPVRRSAAPIETGLPLRDRRTPVTIAGATVTPMRPVTVRPVYNHQPARTPTQFNGAPGSTFTSTGASRPDFTLAPSQGRPGYVSPQSGFQQRPGTVPGTVPGSGIGPAGASHARPTPGGIRSVPVAPPHMASPPPAPRAAPPPPPPPSRPK
jgi:hypothetical protein